LSSFDLKLKGASTDSQVCSAFYSAKQSTAPTYTEEEKDVSPFTSNFNAPLIHQNNVIHAPIKNLFSQIDWLALQKDFS
jgi:hypothetical protein